MNEELFTQLNDGIQEVFELQAKNLDAIQTLWDNQQKLAENDQLIAQRLHELKIWIEYWIDTFKKVLDFPEPAKDGKS